MVESKSDKAGGWSDHIWWSGEGIRLHARFYPGSGGVGDLPILCLPGLTRNARDFEVLAPTLAQGGTVMAVDYRGRGDSGYTKDPMSYAPLTYVQDIVGLVDGLGWNRFAIVGTSLGGVIAMLMAASMPGRIAGVVLNDVGPELEAEGLGRIRGYVGAMTSQPTWLHAARQAAEAHGNIYPLFDVQDWLRLVHRTHRVTPEGRIVPDYDKQIAVPLRLPNAADAADMWPAFAALSDMPLLLVRGELSDVLSAATAAKMGEVARQSEQCVIAQTGHAPTLDEPAAVSAILQWQRRLRP